MTTASKAADLLRSLWPPMLAGTGPTSGTGWICEVKYDGFRALACVLDGDLELRSRQDLPFDRRFDPIKEALRQLPHDVVLDGEIAADTFEHVQDGAEDQCLVAFDILWLGGRDLRRDPIEARREALEELLVCLEADRHCGASPRHRGRSACRK
jgi:bifunctional non-homologous end joining protein LigD